MKIEIKGAYGETNFGDDLLMCVFENFFSTQFSNAKLNFVGEEEEYTSKLLSTSEYGVSNFNPNIIVYGGGTQFFSFSEPKKITRLEKIFKVLKEPKIFLNKFISQGKRTETPDVPTVFLGFGIGPFYVEGPIIQKAKTALINAAFVGVRDEVSYKYCENWGIDACLGADVVFSSYFHLPKLPEIKNVRKKRIGIIVRDWNWESTGASYIESLKKVYTENHSDYDFQFIVFAPLKDKKWMESIAWSEMLIWDPEKFTIDEFLSSLNQFDAFISARYHGAIIASLLNKPVICIEIEDKLKILTNQLKELKLWRKPFNEKELIDHLRTLNYDVNYSNSRNALAKKADDMLSSFQKFMTSKLG